MTTKTASTLGDLWNGGWNTVSAVVDRGGDIVASGLGAIDSKEDTTSASTSYTDTPVTEDPKYYENIRLYNSSDPVLADTLNESQRLVDLGKNALIIGGGIGLSWYALKKLVERAYRKRLATMIAEDDQVLESYEQRTTPISNEYLTLKQSSVNKPTASEIRDIEVKDLESDNALGDNNYVLLSKTDWSPAHIAAKNSWLWDPVLGMSVPAVLALGMWGGSSLAKQLVKRIAPEEEYSLSSEKVRAKRRYDTAAKLLRDVSSGKSLKKRSSVRVKQAHPLLWGLGLLGAAMVADGVSKHRKNQEATIVPDSNAHVEFIDGSISDNRATNTLAGLAALGGAALLTVPAYRFVQSMRSGYKNRTKSLSDVVRSAQAWEALRRSRDYDYASLRAALRDEPDLGFPVDPVEEAEFRRKPNKTFTI